MARTVAKRRQRIRDHLEPKRKFLNDRKKEFLASPELNESPARHQSLPSGGDKKKPRPPVEDRKRRKIIEWFENGVTVTKIADRLDITNSCVSRIIKKYRETGSFEPGVAGAVSKVFTPEIVQKMIELKRENPKMYAWEVRDKLLPNPSPSSCISSINRIFRLNKSEWEPGIKIVRCRHRKPTALTPEVTRKIVELKTRSPLMVVRKIRQQLYAEGVCNKDNLPGVTTIQRFLKNSNLSVRQVLKNSGNCDEPDKIQIQTMEEMLPGGLEIPALLRREKLTTDQDKIFEEEIPKQILENKKKEKQKKSKKKLEISLPARKRKDKHKKQAQSEIKSIETAHDQPALNSQVQNDTYLPLKKRKSNRIPQNNEILPLLDKTINVSIFKDFPSLSGCGNFFPKQRHGFSKQRKISMRCLNNTKYDNFPESNALRLYNKSRSMDVPRSRDASPFKDKFDQTETPVEPCKVVRLDEINTFSCLSLSSQHQMNRILYTHSAMDRNTHSTQSSESDFPLSAETNYPYCKIEEDSPAQFDSIPCTPDKLEPPPLVNCFIPRTPRRPRHPHVKFELPLDLVSSDWHCDKMAPVKR